MASRRDRDEHVDNARLGLLEAAKQGSGCTPAIQQAHLINARADGPTDRIEMGAVAVDLPLDVWPPPSESTA
jgi:hypothetical protein